MRREGELSEEEAMLMEDELVDRLLEGQSRLRREG
jgi:hypothetical protein